MKSKGKVSLWIGNFNNVDSLKYYVCIGSTADGDQIYSKFANNFDIGHIDEPSLEFDFFEKKRVMAEEVLKQFSYSKTIIHNYIKFKNQNKFDFEINSVILLYDFIFKGDILKDENVSFLGTIDYLDKGDEQND
jgi:hypothetical protein